MTEHDDYSDLLDGNVDEVKDRIREKDDIDLEKLREAEEEGDDRKSIKEFIDEQMDSEEMDDELDDIEFEDVDDAVDQAEQGVDPKIAFGVGGAVLGLIIGMAVGVFGLAGSTGVSGDSPDMTAQEIKSDLDTYWSEQLDRADFEGDYQINNPEMRNGMYYTTIDTNGTVGNQTIEQTQGVYVSTDGELLFSEVTQMGQVVRPVQLQELLTSLENQTTTQEDQMSKGEQTTQSNSDQEESADSQESETSGSQNGNQEQTEE